MTEETQKPAEQSEKLPETVPEETGGSRKPDGTFAPGHSGNPNGRKPGSISLVGILKEELEKVPKGDKSERARRLIRRIIRDAEEGSAHAQKLIMNYMEGLPKQPVDLGVDKESLGELTKFFQAMAKPKDEEEEGEEV